MSGDPLRWFSGHMRRPGTLITFAPTPWYPTYTETADRWGLTPLEDQQLGSLAMWLPGGLAELLLTGRLLREDETQTRWRIPW